MEYLSILQPGDLSVLINGVHISITVRGPSECYRTGAVLAIQGPY